MGNVLDILKQDAFSMVHMTEAINKLPFKPSRIGSMGLFKEQGITTTSILLEEQNGLLALLPTKRRGEPATVGTAPKRTARSLAVPHIPFDDVIRADDIQDIRAFGSSTELQTVSSVVNARLLNMRQNHEVTLEYHRIGAIKGNVLDADGVTTLYNLFTEFGVAETTIAFDLAVATTDIRDKCLAVHRAMEAALGSGTTYDRVHAFCGSTWFTRFIGHEYVRDAYHRWHDSENLRNDPRKGFEFGGITFEEYRGRVSGVDFISADEARFFPVGAPQLFTTYFAPADFVETVNTIGLPIYAKQEPLPMNRGVHIHTQSNPLCICNRPGCLIKGAL